MVPDASLSGRPLLIPGVCSKSQRLFIKKRLRGLQGSFTLGCLRMARAPCSALHLGPLPRGAHLELAGQREGSPWEHGPEQGGPPPQPGPGPAQLGAMEQRPGGTGQVAGEVRVCAPVVRAPAGGLPPGRAAASDPELLPHGTVSLLVHPHASWGPADPSSPTPTVCFPLASHLSGLFMALSISPPHLLGSCRSQHKHHFPKVIVSSSPWLLASYTFPSHISHRCLSHTGVICVIICVPSAPLPLNCELQGGPPRAPPSPPPGT